MKQRRPAAKNPMMYASAFVAGGAAAMANGYPWVGVGLGLTGACIAVAFILWVTKKP